MDRIEEDIHRRLFELQDLKYKEFQCKLMPTINPETVIGVRTPDLRKLAKEYSRTRRLQSFSKCCLTHIMKKITCTVF